MVPVDKHIKSPSNNSRMRAVGEVTLCFKPDARWRSRQLESYRFIPVPPKRFSPCMVLTLNRLDQILTLLNVQVD